MHVISLKESVFSFPPCVLQTLNQLQQHFHVNWLIQQAIWNNKYQDLCFFVRSVQPSQGAASLLHWKDPTLVMWEKLFVNWKINLSNGQLVELVVELNETANDLLYVKLSHKIKSGIRVQHKHWARGHMFHLPTGSLALEIMNWFVFIAVRAWHNSQGFISEVISLPTRCFFCTEKCDSWQCLQCLLPNSRGSHRAMEEPSAWFLLRPVRHVVY